MTRIVLKTAYGTAVYDHFQETCSSHDRERHQIEQEFGEVADYGARCWRVPFDVHARCIASTHVGTMVPHRIHKIPLNCRASRQL